MIKVEVGGGRSLSGEMGLVERLFVDYKSRVCVVKSVLCDIEYCANVRILLLNFPKKRRKYGKFTITP